jgi:alkyl sulfatase BDS1-like metallo-beta-lactamase superfamily hydrolase
MSGRAGAESSHLGFLEHATDHVEARELQARTFEQMAYARENRRRRRRHSKA